MKTIFFSNRRIICLGAIGIPTASLVSNYKDFQRQRQRFFISMRKSACGNMGNKKTARRGQDDDGRPLHRRACGQYHLHQRRCLPPVSPAHGGTPRAPSPPKSAMTSAAFTRPTCRRSCSQGRCARIERAAPRTIRSPTLSHIKIHAILISAKAPPCCNGLCRQ